MADINDIIAQGPRPPQVDDPQTAYAKSLTLGNLMQERQLRAQQIQSGNVQLQQQQLALADQQAMRGAMAAWDGKDPQDLFNLARQRGVSPAQLLQLQNSILDQKTKVATLDKTQRENALSRNTALQSHLAPVAAETDPLKQEAAYNAALADAVRAGDIPAEEAAQHPYRGPDAVKQYVQGLNFEKWTLSQQQQQRANAEQTTAAKNAAELPGLQADALTKQLASASQQLSAAKSAQDYAAAWNQLPAGIARRFPTPEQWTPQTPALAQRIGLTSEQATTADQAAANAAEAAKRDQQTARYQNAELNNAAANIALRRQANEIERVKADPYGALGLNQNTQPGFQQNLHGTAFLGTLPPALANTVKAIAEGRETMTARDRSGPQGQFLNAAVIQYDPTWSEQRAQLRHSFLVGKQGDNIGNLNTAVVHGDQLLDAAAAMKNGNFQPGNSAYNAIATTFGANAVTNFEALKTAWAGEVATALKGTATDQEIEHIASVIKSKNSMDQLAGAVKEYIPVLGAKLNTADERYHAINADDPWSPVLPSAGAVFQKNGMQPIRRLNNGAAQGGGQQQSGGQQTGQVTEFKVTDPNGKTHYFKSQADANRFKSMAGIK